MFYNKIAPIQGSRGDRVELLQGQVVTIPIISFKNAVVRLINTDNSHIQELQACKNFGYQEVRVVLGGFMCFRVCNVIFNGWLKIIINTTAKANDTTDKKRYNCQLYRLLWP